MLQYSPGLCREIKYALNMKMQEIIKYIPRIFPHYIFFFPCSTSSNTVLYTAVPCIGFYIQPDVLYLSEHPESQYVVANSDISLSCSVQLQGLRREEGGLHVPIVQWTVNNTNVSNVR